MTGWDFSSSSVYSMKDYAKNGNRFASLSDKGYIAQFVHLTTVECINFYYMSETRGSTIEVLIDDKSFLNYTIESVGIGKWEQVILNVSEYTGFHSLKFLQHNGRGYIDYINCIRNNDIAVNFTLSSFSLNGDNLTVSFNDCSYGLIDGWLWDFGDEKTSTIQNVTHSYKTGHYTISLTVFNDKTTKMMSYVLPISFPTIERTGIEYGSVQEAVNNAQNGDIINVPINIFTGILSEHIIVNKNLTLNFFNCTLMEDNDFPIISVVDGANVIVNNVSFKDAYLETDDLSSLTINQLNAGNVFLLSGNFEFKDTMLHNSNIMLLNADCNIANCNFINCGVIVNGGKSKIFNNTFCGSDVAITQTAGALDIISNLITDNNIGVNITGGISNLTLNILYDNNISLVYNTSDIFYDDNWWGTNNPYYVYSYDIVYCDVLQVGGLESPLNSWLVLNITQSDVLDYKYYIAGITYYNLTVDLSHNNNGEDINSYGFLKDFILNLTNVDEHVYYESHSFKGNIEKKFISIVSNECLIINNRGSYVCSLGYLTSDLTELKIRVLGIDYIVSISNNIFAPNITYITPFTVFNNTLSVEIKCEGIDAVIFYTLDGSNPAYSSTR